MIKADNHNAVINRIARTKLKPLGLKQKGKSRIWLDDHYWFTVIVEFQPSSYEKGTYLNVGINFNWYKKEYLSFDYGSRVGSFVKFLNEDSFEVDFQKMVEDAIVKICEYRLFEDLNYARIQMIESDVLNEDLWGNYHKGMINLITGEYDIACSYFKLIIKTECKFDWQKELVCEASKLTKLIGERNEIKSTVDKIIIETRGLKKLDR